MELTFIVIIGIAVTSFLCEYMDASLGMGYGTTLTPLLLLAGFSPLQIVPAVLIGQMAGGIVGGICHHKFGNIKLDFRRDEELIKRKLRGLGYIPTSPDSKVVFFLAIFGILGSLVAVFVAVNIPNLVLKTYIGVMVLAIGLMILFRRNHEFTFSWIRLIVIGLISSFNKGISGGGYGPLVTGGQIISGRDVRGSVGSTTMAEAFVCIVAFLGYLIVGENIYWKLAATTSIGSILAGPFASLTVKKMQTKRLKLIIGILTTILGTLTLAKTYVF